MENYVLFLEKEIEKKKKEAIDLLNKEKNGIILLNEQEKERLKRIALGEKFFSEDEKEKIEEILNLSFFSYQEFLNQPECFDEKIIAIEKVIGSASSFIYPLIIISSKNSQEVLEISSEFSKIYFLVKEKFNEKFSKLNKGKEYRLNFLMALRDILLELRPQLIDDFINLKEAIIYYQMRKKIPFLYLLIIEIYILKMFNYFLNFVKREKDFLLAIKVDNKLLYWEVAYSSPLSYVPVDFGLTISFLQFFSYYVNFYSSKINNYNLAIRNLEFLRKILESKKLLGKEYFLTLKNLSLLYLGKEDLVNAKKIAEIFCRVNPNSYEGYLLLGNILAKKQEYEEALKLYEKILSFDFFEEEKENVLSQVYCNQGYIFLNLNKIAEAIESFQKALELKPNYFEAYFNLGNAYFQKRDFSLAEKNYQKALKLNKRIPMVYFQLGRLYTEWNKKEKAIQYYKKLIALEPNNYMGLYNLGLLYRDLGKKEEAAKYLEKAIRLNPNLGK
ncbi:MAG: tetratricopeptide repeat protein [candidate division WOR-3 bacterium]|nr:tetratricopeptide repeat protein [candidate division WOR-3 bacterium]MDW8113980.1 tetratricopeptide repeat protein [candidate division WOR-3 bacterium]